MFILISLQVDPLSASTIFAICIWLSLVGFLWAIGEALLQGLENLRRLHQIPCYDCAYFTGDYRLKCTLHPTDALSEEAIGCRDYEPANMSSFSRGGIHDPMKDS